MAAEDLTKYFKKGSPVEISSNDEGFRGAWYSGTVIRPPSAKSKEKKALVEYESLMADEAGKKRLRETLDWVQLRPPPPQEPLSRGSFNFSEEVDAYYNDGWWEGVITEVLEDGRYSVFFRGTREQLEFGGSELRLHREWVNGKWVPSVEGEEEILGVEKVPIVHDMKPSKEMVKVKFSKGMLVEVTSDEDGFQGAWFAATIIGELTEDKFLIEYKSLRNDDDTEFLREEADTLHIRPYPPNVLTVDRFNLHEEVDALYNDGWWVGVITKVLKGQRYMVYFRGTDEEMGFKCSDLRLHQDWIDGKWIMASQSTNLEDQLIDSQTQSANLVAQPTVYPQQLPLDVPIEVPRTTKEEAKVETKVTERATRRATKGTIASSVGPLVAASTTHGSTPIAEVAKPIVGILEEVGKSTAYGSHLGPTVDVPSLDAGPVAVATKSGGTSVECPHQRKRQRVQVSNLNAALKL